MDRNKLKHFTFYTPEPLARIPHSVHLYWLKVNVIVVLFRGAPTSAPVYI